jgi:dTMP kinase
LAGKFIVFEGPDGCGKSTMLEAARRHLEVKGIDAVFVQDPGGTKIGGQLRKVLLDKKNSEMCAMTELLLYVASRAQLVEEVILPALNDGRLVVSDRFTVSTLAYQGAAGAVPEGKLREVVSLGVGNLCPDRVILLDVPAGVGLERVGKSKDRMELKGLKFFEDVRSRYLGFADASSADRVTVVDACASILEVKREVLEIIDEVLEG